MKHVPHRGADMSRERSLPGTSLARNLRARILGVHAIQLSGQAILPVRMGLRPMKGDENS